MSDQPILTEILCEIFHHLCKKPISLHTLENRTCYEDFPWVVGQVCRRWRATFLSHPRLWTSLSLMYTASPETKGNKPKKFAEMNRRTALYLKRSGQLPLTLIIVINTPVHGRIHHVPRATWRSLLSCSERWKKVNLWLGNFPCMADDLLERRDKFPMLESMSLQIDNSISECKAQDSAFAVAPRLTELYIQHYGANSSRWVFPWSQLTTFRTRMSPKYFILSKKPMDALLSQLQNVEDLHFHFKDGHIEPYSRPPASIRIPRVRFLKVTVTRYPYIFRWLELPLLEHLWVNGAFNYVSIDRELWNAEMQPFFNQSSHHIRRLTFGNCYGDLARTFMGELTRVEHLCIKHPSHSQATDPLNHLITSSDDGIYLPNLQEVQIICCSRLANERLTVEVSRLLEARCKQASVELTGHRIVPLERVIIQPKWGKYCYCMGLCWDGSKNVSRINALDEMFKQMCSWSPGADISVDRMHFQICIKPRLTVVGSERRASM